MTRANAPIAVRWSKADDAFITEVPALPGRIAHDKSRAAARAADAIAPWPATAWEFGDPIPPSGGQVPTAAR